jgi:WD40 repeat protein
LDTLAKRPRVDRGLSLRSWRLALVKSVSAAFEVDVLSHIGEDLLGPLKSEVLSYLTVPSGVKLAVGTCSSCLILDATAGTVNQRLEYADWVRTVAWGSGSSVATGSDDRQLRVVDPDSGTVVREVPMADWICTVAYSPDGRHLATGCRDGTLRIEDAFTGCVEREVQLNWARSATWGKDSKTLVAGARDGTLTFVGPEARKVKLDAWVFAISWDPTGSRLAVASGDTMCVLSEDGAKEFEVAHGGNVVACAWSPCGDFIVTASECCVKILDAQTGKMLSEVKGEANVRCATWSPCGKYVATGGDDGVIRFIDRNGKIDRVFDAPGCKYVLSLAYNP